MSNKNLIEAANVYLQAVHNRDTAKERFGTAGHFEQNFIEKRKVLSDAIAEAEQAESQTQEWGMRAAHEIRCRGIDFNDEKIIAAIITKHAPDATLERDAIEALRDIADNRGNSCSNRLLCSERAREVLRRAEGKGTV